MDNLQLTVGLSTGTALGHPWINAEGLLQRFALIDHAGRGYDEWLARLGTDGPVDLRDDDRVDTGLAYTDGLAHASVSQFDTDRRATTTLYSSYDEIRSHTVGGSRPRTKIPTAGGTFKSQMIEVTYLPARACTFYLRADSERVRTLLDRHLTGLGKHTARGFGAVRDWDLRSLDADYSLVHPSEAIAMRPIPTDRLEEWDDAATLTYRPPYHYDPWAGECAPPGAEVVAGW